MATMFDSLINMIGEGKEGKNKGISVGLDHIRPTINVKRSTYTILGGLSGTGKTAIADYLFVLNAYRNALKEGKPFEIVYFSYERKKEFKLAKWVCARLMWEYGIVMDVENMLYWNGKRSNMSREVYEKVVECKEWFDRMLEHVHIHDRKDNPTGIYKTVLQHLSRVGTIHTRTVTKDNGEQLTLFDKYVSNDPEQVVMVVMDHMGLLPVERGFSVKENIDKLSEYFTILRDSYGCSITAIQQFNRNLSDPNRKKQNDISPRRDDLKDSSDTENDCDMFLGIMDPLEFGIGSYNDYNAIKMVTPDGFRRFRSLHVVKNSYGGSGGMIGLAFYGESGLVIPLGKPTLFAGHEQDFIQFSKHNYDVYQNLSNG
jgi:hypothetical protein